MMSTSASVADGAPVCFLPVAYGTDACSLNVAFNGSWGVLEATSNGPSSLFRIMHRQASQVSWLPALIVGAMDYISTTAVLRVGTGTDAAWLIAENTGRLRSQASGAVVPLPDPDAAVYVVLHYEVAPTHRLKARTVLVRPNQFIGHIEASTRRLVPVADCSAQRPPKAKASATMPPPAPRRRACDTYWSAPKFSTAATAGKRVVDATTTTDAPNSMVDATTTADAAINNMVDATTTTLAVRTADAASGDDFVLSSSSAPPFAFAVGANGLVVYDHKATEQSVLCYFINTGTQPWPLDVAVADVRKQGGESGAIRHNQGLGGVVVPPGVGFLFSWRIRTKHMTDIGELRFALHSPTAGGVLSGEPVAFITDFPGKLGLKQLTRPERTELADWIKDVGSDEPTLRLWEMLARDEAPTVSAKVKSKLNMKILGEVVDEARRGPQSGAKRRRRT